MQKEEQKTDNQQASKPNDMCQLTMAERSQKYRHLDDSSSQQQEERGRYLYMGMHYMNSACQYVKFGSKEHERAKKSENCIIDENGTVQAIKKIIKNVELLAGYDSTMTAENGSKETCTQVKGSSKRGRTERKDKRLERDSHKKAPDTGDQSRLK